MSNEQEILKALPHLLQEIARVTSVDVALKIADAWGGTYVYIPSEGRATSKLAQLVGEENARKIGAALGGEERAIPMMRASGKMKVAIIQSTDSAATTAKKLGCTERHVRRVRVACGMRGSERNGHQPSPYEQRILDAEGSPQEVAAKIGCPESFVRSVRTKFGVKADEPPVAPQSSQRGRQ